ncbi:DUF4834 family protein [Flavobacterium agrisoli]|uniref:DUF4834 family protein n=1 Tax=Flavobacterium agrisoli TaxID=2793066 RepID=A0A934UJI2_9FLAO|nr:DUF4834 family protein [Flavobacterium agrisoli]MBK0369991.1 DUF4834 family protein [Flavobacterium agrisoli]
MQEASFSGLLRSIVYIIAFYYIFRFVAKLLFPIVVKKVVNKAAENFQQQQQYSQQYRQDNSWQKTQNNKDEIIYNTAKSKYPHETKKVGEYVDYEEID